ncbi:hypothetical protein GCM10011588_27170 [Nocardia jinanensis]|uniref:Uncharacterized protein n=1 Tax=Nocardia jinanensis TaxID=382504 RepID=A0A917RJI7_9NOCA|nr:hypothetical protein GCM10011588_27170 [Nocardia jinanensis]
MSSSAATSRAIAGTSVPDADAMMIIARRIRIADLYRAAQSVAAVDLPRRSADALEPVPLQITPHN